MPNISAGASETVAVAVAQDLSIQTPGGAAAKIMVDGIVREIVTGARIIGDYAEGKSVTISAEGGPVFYEVLTGRVTEGGAPRWNRANDALMNDSGAEVPIVRRDHLADASDSTKGAAMVGFSGRSVASRLAEAPSIKDKGAVGNGVVGDAAALQSVIDSNPEGAIITLPPGTFLLDATVTISKANVRLRGAAGNYSPTKFRLAAGVTVGIQVNREGFIAERIGFEGDGAAYGAGATQTAIVLRGNINGSDYDVDGSVRRCVFSRLAAGVEVRGKNTQIEGNLFSQCLRGVKTLKAGGGFEFRGLVIDGNRFHSIGSQNVDAAAIELTAADDLLEVQITNNYFDDCYELVRGFAAPIQILGNMASRNWGGIRLNTTGRTASLGISRNIVDVCDNILHFITTATVSDAVALYSNADVQGRVSSNIIFNPSGHGVALDSAASVVMAVEVSGNTIRDPGDGGAYDCIRLGAEVGGVRVHSNSLDKGDSTTTGVGLRTTGGRTATGADMANLIGRNRYTGFSAASRMSLGNNLDFGDPAPIANERAMQNVSLTTSFSAYVGNNAPLIRLFGTLTENVNLTILDTNVYDGARFRIYRTGGGAYAWTIIANGTTAATLANRYEFVDLVYDSATADWVVVSKGSAA